MLGILRVALPLVAALALMPAAATGAFAAGGPNAAVPVKEPAKNSAQPGTVSTPNNLVNTVIALGTFPGTLKNFQAGDNFVHGPIAINCANAGGCRIGVEGTVQVGNSVADENDVTLFVRVDGVPIRPCDSFGCPVSGQLFADGGYTTFSFMGAYPMAAGAHTVEMEVNLAAPAQFAGAYTIFYRIYTP